MLLLDVDETEDAEVVSGSAVTGSCIRWLVALLPDAVSCNVLNGLWCLVLSALPPDGPWVEWLPAVLADAPEAK